MSMVEPVGLSLERLRVALATMDEDHRGFETTLAEAPDFYCERSHALALSMHAQSLYSQIEDLLILRLEKRGLAVRRLGDWRPLLLQAATVDVPNGPRALLREHTPGGLASMLRMHQASGQTRAPSSLIASSDLCQLCGQQSKGPSRISRDPATIALNDHRLRSLAPCQPRSLPRNRN